MRYLFGLMCVLALGAIPMMGCNDGGGGLWGTAERIDSDHEDGAGAQSVAMDPQGNAIAVWSQLHGTEVGGSIWSNRLTPSGGWGTAELIETEDVGNAYGPDVAMDPQGNAVAVWRRLNTQGDPGHTFWSNRFEPLEGWQTEERIDNNDQGSTGYPKVAMDHQGNAVAVWPQRDGTQENVWANRFMPSDGWGTAERFEDNAEHDAQYPQVAMDAQGNAIVVWGTAVTEDFGMASAGGSGGGGGGEYGMTTFHHIWSNRFTPTGGWENPKRVDNHEDNAAHPQIAVDPQGNAIAVWEHTAGLVTNIWSNRFTPSNGWEDPVRIDSLEWSGSPDCIQCAARAWSPQVAIDSQGRALTVWYQAGPAQGAIWSNRHTLTRGWGAAERISNDTFPTTTPDIAMDASGNATAAWFQWDGGVQDNIWASRFAPSGGWETPELIENEEGSAFYPQVAMDQHGRTVAVWSQWDGERYNIWSNRFR